MLLSRTRCVRAIVSACVAVGLLTGPAPRAQTSDAQGAKQVLGAYGTVVGHAYPVAGAIVKALTDLLDAVGFFGGEPDPLARIQPRLDALQAQITQLQEAVALLHGDQLRERNQQRLWRLKDTRDRLEAIVSVLRQKPA